MAYARTGIEPVQTDWGDVVDGVERGCALKALGRDRGSDFIDDDDSEYSAFIDDLDLHRWEAEAFYCGFDGARPWRNEKRKADENQAVRAGMVCARVVFRDPIRESVPCTNASNAALSSSEP